MSADLTALAKKMRMNTDIRRTIFCVIMSSDVRFSGCVRVCISQSFVKDFMDCFEKLHKLNLKGKQEREIVRVLLECASQEATSNPCEFFFPLLNSAQHVCRSYYSHVAQKLCSFASAYKFTFQVF